jgi:hypothetical protein
MSTSKTARQSRTLRFNAKVSWLVTAAAALPSILSYAIELMGDPVIAAAVADVVPLKYRSLLALVVLIVAQRNRALRKQTTVPIVEERTLLP